MKIIAACGASIHFCMWKERVFVGWFADVCVDRARRYSYSGIIVRFFWGGNPAVPAFFDEM